MGAFSGPIGSLWIEVGAKIQDFEKNMAVVSKQVDATYKDVAKTFGGFDKLGASLSNVGRSLSLAFTVPLVGAGVAVTKFAADFETGMRQVTSLLGGVADKEFKQLSDATLTLSKNLGVDAVKSAQALYEAISAGVPKENALTFLEVASKAAIAGVTDTKVAVDGMTNIINAFGLEMSQAQEVSDAMFQAVNVGKFTFEQLSGSVGIASGTASQMGVSFKELLASAASITKQGFSVSEAFTNLQSVMTALIKPSESMVDLLKKTGFASGEALLKAKGLQGAIQALDVAAKHNSTTLAEAYGRVEALKGSLALTGDNAVGAAKDLDQITNSAGAASKAFEEIDKTTARQFQRLVQELKITAIELGTSLLPAVNSVLQAVKPMIKLIGEAVDWFGKLSPGVQTAALAVAALGAAIGPVLVVAGTLVSSITSIYTGFGLLAGAGGVIPLATAALGAITPIAIAFGVAIAGWAIYKAVTEIQKLNTELDRLYDLQSRGVKAGEEQRRKIAQLESAIASYNKQIGNQRISVDATGKSIDEYTNALEEAVQSIRNTAGASQKFETGLEGIKVVTGKVKQATDQASTGYRDHKKSVEDVGKAMATVADDVGPRLTKRFELLDEISRQLQTEHQQHISATAKLTIELGRMADGIDQASRATEGLIEDMGAIPGGMQNISSVAPQFGQDIADAIGYGLPKIEEVTEELEELAETGKASMEDFSTKSQDTFSTWAKQVSTIITDAGKSIFRRFAEAGEQNERLDEDAAKLRESLAEREQSYAEFSANIAAKLAEANADYQETLAKEEQSLRESLAERQLDYEEFAASVADKLAEFTKKNAEQADKQKQSLLDSLEDRTRDYEDYKGDVEDRIKDIRDSHAKSVQKEVKALNASLADRKKDYDRYVEDVNKRLGRIRAKNKGLYSDEEDDLLTSLKRRTEDFQEFTNEASTKILDITKAHRDEADKQERDQRDALARRERDYRLYQDEIAKKLNDVTVKHQEAQLKEEADLKASLEKKKVELDKYTAEASNKFEGTRAAAAAKLAEQEADLKSSLAKQTAEWEKFTTDVNAQLQSIADKHLGIFGKLASVGAGIFKDLGEAVGRFVAEELIGKLFKSLADLVSDILPGVGKALGGIFGSGGAAAGAAGQAGGAAGGAGSAGGAAGAAGGFASIAGAIGSIGSFITGIGGMFQNARQENTLNAIEESIRYMKIWTGEREWSIMQNTGKAREYLGYITATTDGIGKKLDEWLEPSKNSLQQIAEAIPLAQTRLDEISHNTSWGSAADRDNTSVLHTLRELLGADRTPQITVYVNGVQQPASAVSLKLQGVLV